MEMLVTKPDPLNVSESLHQELSIQVNAIPHLQTMLLSSTLYFFVSVKENLPALQCYNCTHGSFAVDHSMGILYTSSEK